VKPIIAQADLVVFSDFNYGCLAQPLVDAVVALCKERHLPMAADSQSSSQVGDVSRFRDMMLLKPTEREARLALRDFNSGLVIVAEAIRTKTRAENVILTLGPEGLLVHANSNTLGSVVTDRLPAFNQAPRDTAGAGDSLLMSAALALVVGADVWRSAYLGSLAAACQVGRIGNVPLTAADIAAEIDT
jgi:bifunctional ADP-heptose synthase (sugar kinase/adenylyltransferase)